MSGDHHDRRAGILDSAGYKICSLYNKLVEERHPQQCFPRAGAFHHAGVGRLLKKYFHGLFQHGRSCASLRPRHWGFLPGTKQKARFLLRSIFQTLIAFEKWRHVPLPHRRLLKNEFFNNLLCRDRRFPSVPLDPFVDKADKLLRNSLLHVFLQEMSRISHQIKFSVGTIWAMRISPLGFHTLLPSTHPKQRCFQQTIWLHFSSPSSTAGAHYYRGWGLKALLIRKPNSDTGMERGIRRFSQA